MGQAARLRLRAEPNPHKEDPIWPSKKTRASTAASRRHHAEPREQASGPCANHRSRAITNARLAPPLAGERADRAPRGGRLSPRGQYSRILKLGKGGSTPNFRLRRGDYPI